jgi:hypothetical protein
VGPADMAASERATEAFFASLKKQHGEAKAREIFTKAMARKAGRKKEDRNMDALNASMALDDWRRDQDPRLPRRDFMCLFLVVERQLGKNYPEEFEAYSRKFFDPGIDAIRHLGELLRKASKPDADAGQLFRSFCDKAAKEAKDDRKVKAAEAWWRNYVKKEYKWSDE